MKKLLPTVLTILCLFGLLPKSVHAKKAIDTKETLAGQIEVTGMDPMGSPFTNGQTNVSEQDGTLFMDTATGSFSDVVFTIANLNFIDDLNISNVTITGTDASDFGIEGIPPVIVGAGLSDQLIVKFIPQTVGTKNATVTIFSDDPTNGTFTFAIQGTALEGATGLHFDGVDDYISFNNGNYSLSDNFAIELWMNPEVSGTEEHYILDTQNAGSTGHSLYIDLNSQLNFVFYTSSGVKILTSGSTIQNQWQHIVVKYDGIDYKMFINGTEEASLTLSESIADSIDNLTLGSFASGVGQFYAGGLDELRVWDIALSSCRISDQSSCELTGDESDLLAYYTFNSGEVNGNNFPFYTLLDPDHTITSGIPPQGTLNNFGLTGTTSNWIDTTANGISGTCSTYTESIIVISGNSNPVNNGDVSVSSSNNTSFGNVEFGQAEPADYTISNMGNATLNISNITIDGASDFTIIESPTTVAAGTSENLRILFTPSSNGAKNATVRVLNDDCDNATFEFAIEGTGFIPATGISLDGTDDHISISHNALFNTSIFTIEGYFKTSVTSQENPIVSKYDTANDNGYAVYLTDAGRLRLYFKSSNHTAYRNSSISELNDGDWHHFSLVFGNQISTLYIDGVLDSDYSISTITNAPTNSENVFIGYSTYTNTYFSGELDDIRFWSRALCSDEITAQQSCELTGSESDLVAYYNLNEGNVDANNASVTTADDVTSNSLDGTLMNFALTGSTSNWTDTSANGISGNCSIAIPEINVQGNGNDILNGDTSPETVDNTDAGTVDVGSSQNMNFNIRNTDGTGDLLVSSITLSGDTTEFTVTLNTSGNPILAAQSAGLTIAFHPTSGGTKTATVIIDSDDCDEPSYSFTIQGTGVPPGTGLDFDGTDDIVTIPHNASQNNLNFSVDFWIKTTDGLGGVINKFTPDGNNGWRINLDGGRIEFYYYASSANYVTRLLSPETSVNDGDWHHVAVTLDSGSARCYIDGVLARSTGWNGTATATTTTADIQIGYAAADTPSGDTGGYFDGQLDELRIWTKTLSVLEIENLNGCTTDMTQTDLAASYNFNEGIAAADNSGLTTLADGSGNNYNGTLTNFALNGSTSNWIHDSANNITGSCDCVVVGGVTLTTQSEVDNFTTTLGSCGIIEGDVTINGTITDLSGFSNIHTISGDLYLEGNIADDLSGFTSLTTIGGDLTFKDMTNTTSISAFANVANLEGNFEVDNLDQLSEISIFNQQISISGVVITGNSALMSITLDQLQTVNGNFTITFNGSLSSLSVPQLTQVTNEFRMNNNGSGMTDLSLPLLESTSNFLLADMNGLQSINAPELLTVTSNLSVGSCSALTTLTLPKLTSVSSNVSIDNSLSLDTITTTVLMSIGGSVSLDDLAIPSLDFLQNVTSMSSLSLRDLTMLSNLQGLDELTSLNSFNLTSCDLVTSLEGFPKLNITSFESLNISGNEGITSLSNSFLESLTTMENLGISFNGNLIEIDALQNLTSLTDTGDSTIRDNGALQSINLYALRNVSANLVIQNQNGGINNLCGLYDYVTVGDGATTLSFLGTNSTDWDSVQDILDNCNTGVTAKVFLQGATLNPNTGEESLMRDDLRTVNYIPTTSPYTDALTSGSGIFNTTGDNAILDWVWLELRDAADNTSVVASRSALLQRDGDIVDTDGISAIYFTGATAGDYYLVVNHRNHLGVMTAATVNLSSTITTVDFTDGSVTTYGTNAQTTYGMPAGVSGMWSGDANGDGTINLIGGTNDTNTIRDTILNDPINQSIQFYGFNVTGYNDSDVNLSGGTQIIGSNNDANLVRDNILNHPINTFIQFYGFNITEQLPENVSTKRIAQDKIMQKKIQELATKNDN